MSTSAPAPSDVASSLFSGVERAARVPRTAPDYRRLDLGPYGWQANVRALLDTWYRQLPDQAKASVRSRFISDKRDEHLGGFFELYMHELTRCLADDPPDVDIGSEDPARRMTDLVMHRGGQACAIEVTACMGDDVIDPRARPRVRHLYEAIERVKRSDFLLYVDVRRPGLGLPGRRNVTRFLDDWLKGLDPDVERERAALDLPPAQATWRWEGWTVHFQATGLRKDLRGEPRHTVIGEVFEGLGGYTHRFVGERTIELDGPRPLDDRRLLERKLVGKAHHGYDTGDQPLVIAVLCDGECVRDHEIAQALFGPIDYRLGGTAGWQAGGLWRNRGGWRYTRVSAVMTVADLSPLSVAVVEPTAWLNPAATHPLPRDLFPWRTMEVGADERIGERPASRAVADVLGVSPSFPREYQPV